MRLVYSTLTKICILHQNYTITCHKFSNIEDHAKFIQTIIMSTFATVLLFLLFIVLAMLLWLATERCRAAGVKYLPRIACIARGGGSSDTHKKYDNRIINDIVAAIKEHIYARKWFGPEQEEDLTFLNGLIASHDNYPSLEALISIRRVELAYISRKSGVRAMRHALELIKSWKSAPTAETILSLSKKYFIPPTIILRQITEDGGLGKSIVNAQTHTTIEKSDLGSRHWNEIIQTKAIAFEDHVGSLLKKAGIEYLSEYDQRQDPTLAKRLLPRGCKATLATPDFLLIHPVKLGDGRKIHWIDAKDYIGWESDLLYKKLKKQATKYNDAFGWGAFVFSEGYSDDINLNATLMDVGALL